MRPACSCGGSARGVGAARAAAGAGGSAGGRSTMVAPAAGGGSARPASTVGTASAAAFGALAVVAPDRHAPDETGALAKAASGALERIALVRVTNLVRALEALKSAGFWVAGLAGEARDTLAQAKLSGRIALVLGAEGDGLRRLTREHCDLLVRLPMTGDMESLNVSNAAAVALYELIQGNRVNGSCCDEASEEVVVPCGDLAAEAEGVFARRPS
jgi:tRNA C32,U32 (ribose-2'-O)-methylase TrmJ